LLKLMKTEWGLRGRDERLVAESLRVLADQSIDSYTDPLKVLARHPEIRACIVDYRRLIEQPEAMMRQIYSDLELDLSPAAAQEFQAAGTRDRHETAHRYSLDEFGLDPAEIRTRLTALFDQYQWDAEGEHANVR
jgi:hypothetical protein